MGSPGYRRPGTGSAAPGVTQGTGGAEGSGAGAPDQTGPQARPRGDSGSAGGCARAPGPAPPARGEARNQVCRTGRLLTCGAPVSSRSPAGAVQACGRASAGRSTWAFRVRCTWTRLLSSPDSERKLGAGAGPRAGRRGNRPLLAPPPSAHCLQPEDTPESGRRRPLPFPATPSPRMNKILILAQNYVTKEAM